jgi:hypothetical protein
MQYVYFKPYCRIQVYLVGFLLGYVMHRYSNTKTRPPGWVSTFENSETVCMEMSLGTRGSSLQRQTDHPKCSDGLASSKPGFDSYRGQANFSARPVWTHSETTSQTYYLHRILDDDTTWLVCSCSIGYASCVWTAQEYITGG